MPDARRVVHEKPGMCARILQRVAPVLIANCVLFLTLAVAVQAARFTLSLTLADVSIVKGDANPGVRPGGILTYRVFYENSGTLPATDVAITDTLPAHTTHVYNDAGLRGWTTTVSGTLIIWRLDVISPSASGAFDVVLRVAADAPAGASLVNRVDIFTSAAESSTANNSWTTQPTVVRLADALVAKTGPLEVSSGGHITYTIEGYNEGSETADNVVITDTLPAGVSYVTSSGDVGPPVAVNGQQVVWQAGTLPLATGKTLTLVGAVSPDQPSYTTLTNTVEIGTQTPERDRSDNAAWWPAFVRAGPPANIQVSVPLTVRVGSSAMITTTVVDRWSNPVADGTPVSFTSNALITVDPSTVTTGGVATAVVRSGRRLGSAVITATAATAVGTATLDVVHGPVGALRLTPDVDTLTVGSPVGLRAEAFDGFDNPVGAGIPVSFTATLGDVDPAIAATDAAGVVTATLVSTRTGTAIATVHAAGVSDSAMVLFEAGPPQRVDMTADPPAVTVDGAKSQIQATLTDSYGNRVGDGITVTFATSLGAINPVTPTTVAGRATTVLTSGPIHGRAAVTATVGAYTGTTGVEFLPADLRIGSSHSPSGEIPPGTSTTYTITFENAGFATARSVVITNTLPDGLIDTWFESSGAAITTTAGTAYLWQVEDLSPGEGGTIMLHGRFDRDRQWPSSQLVANVALIGSTTAEGNRGDNTASSANVIVTADVFIQGMVDNSGTILEPGGKIKYQVFVGNYGPALAQGLTVTSTLPAHTRLWQETSYQIPGLTRVSADEAPVQVWRFDGTVDGPNFGSFVIWLDIDPQTPGGAMLRHRIEVSSDTPEGNLANNFQEIERRVSGVNLAVLLRAPATIVPQRMITYTLRFTNTGTVPADGVVLAHALPSGVSVISFSREPGRIEPGQVEWELGNVADGQFGQIVVVGRVGAEVPAGQSLPTALSITTTSAESFTGDNTAQVSTLVLPDLPDSLTLEPGRTTLPVGASTPVSMTVADQFGNPIHGLTVTLTATVGVITPPAITTVQGRATATFIAPVWPASGSISASAADLSDSVGIVVEPGPPAVLVASVDADQLPADGASTTVVRVSVVDRYGNRVKDGTPVTFDTDRGRLYNGQLHHEVRTLEGAAATVLRAGSVPGLAVVVARAGAASAQVEVEFVPLPQPPAHTIFLPFAARDHRRD